MAATRNTTSKAANLPEAWGTDGEELETRVLVEKDTLSATPIKILGFEIERNEKRGYDTMFVYALNSAGDEICFADTSDTGVKGQLQKAAADKGLSPAAGAGFVKLPLIVMGGLRVSQFEVQEGRNAGQKTRTFYLQGKASTHS